MRVNELVMMINRLLRLPKLPLCWGAQSHDGVLYSNCCRSYRSIISVSSASRVIYLRFSGLLIF